MKRSSGLGGIVFALFSPCEGFTDSPQKCEPWPQQTALLFSNNPQLWAELAVKATKRSPGGGVVLPYASLPQQTTVPSRSLMPHTCQKPDANAEKRSLSGGVIGP